MKLRPYAWLLTYPRGLILFQHVNNLLENNTIAVQFPTFYYLGGKLVAVRRGADLSYILQDHLGSTTVTADDGGDESSTAHYSPYGYIASWDTLPTDRQFTGQRLDETGLYYYGARYYDHSIGRFISPDTIVPDPYNPQSFNRYS